VFPYQCEGIECGSLRGWLESQRLVAYVLPDGQTLEAAWEFTLVFDSGQAVEPPRVDMTTPVGRAAYATAMMALSTQRTLIVRAHEDSARTFSECRLYDIALM
jgi:hypothetical protein